MKLTMILIAGAALMALPAYAADSSTSAQTSGSNSSVEMSATTASNASDPLASVPNTEKAYKRSNRASDFRKEAETTKELNQQVASAGGLPKQ